MSNNPEGGSGLPAEDPQGITFRFPSGRLFTLPHASSVELMDEVLTAGNVELAIKLAKGLPDESP